MPSNYADVHAFHVRYGLPHPQVPGELTKELFDFRMGFMEEELSEYADAMGYSWDPGAEEWYRNPEKIVDLPKAFDALMDLVYVAMGTSVLQGFPWQAGWDEVQRANMSKERCERKEDSTRGTTFDVIKPAGWTPPDIEGVLARYAQLVSGSEDEVPGEGSRAPVMRITFDDVAQEQMNRMLTDLTRNNGGDNGQHA